MDPVMITIIEFEELWQSVNSSWKKNRSKHQIIRILLEARLLLMRNTVNHGCHQRFLYLLKISQKIKKVSMSAKHSLVNLIVAVDLASIIKQWPVSHAQVKIIALSKKNKRNNILTPCHSRKIYSPLQSYVFIRGTERNLIFLQINKGKYCRLHLPLQ